MIQSEKKHLKCGLRFFNGLAFTNALCVVVEYAPIHSCFYKKSSVMFLLATLIRLLITEEELVNIVPKIFY